MTMSGPMHGMTLKMLVSRLIPNKHKPIKMKLQRLEWRTANPREIHSRTRMVPFGGLSVAGGVDGSDGNGTGCATRGISMVKTVPQREHFPCCPRCASETARLIEQFGHKIVNGT